MLAFLALGVYLAVPLLRPAGRRAGGPQQALEPTRAGNVAPACPGQPVAQAPAPSFLTEPVSSQMTIVELLADTRVNAQRREADLAALEVDERLRDIARLHSQDMFRRGFFAHANPDGDQANERVHRTHRSLIGEVGENIWMCSGCWKGDVDDVVERMVLGPDGWMNSPGHRANILRETFTHGAVAVWQDGEDVWATQLFAATRGYLKADVPRRIARGDCLALEVDPYPASAVAAERFDLSTPDASHTAVDPSPLGARRIDAAAGRYLLRFHFPQGPRRFSVVRGPAVQVQ